MAHSARIAALTDQLVQSVTGLAPTDGDGKSFRACRDVATKGIRSQRFARANQFAVRSSLEGLVEKFQVLNRDDLADELDSRVKELDSRREKWLPDVLSLLLLLSDDPARSTRVEDLDSLGPSRQPPPLTWQEILADDPLTDREVWEDVDFHDSEEESLYESKTFTDDSDDNHQDASTDDVTDLLDVQPLLVSPGKEAQDATESLQTLSSSRLNTEYGLVRESLHVARGLQSKPLTKNNSSDEGHMALVQTSGQTIDNLFTSFDHAGQIMRRLQLFVDAVHRETFIQAFASSVSAALIAFHAVIAEFEERIVTVTGPTLISLLDAQQLVLQENRLLVQLDLIVQELRTYVSEEPHRLLDTMFFRIGDVQSLSDDNTYQHLLRAFDMTFNAYLRRVQRWMEEGTLDANSTFFIKKNSNQTELHSLWNHHYRIDPLQAPVLIQDCLPTILSSGKSVAFMRELGLETQYTQTGSGQDRSFNLYQAAFAAESSIIPLDLIFQSTLNEWLSARHLPVATALTKRMLTDCNLNSTIIALQNLYLSRNGAAFSSFAEAIFSRVDTIPTVGNVVPWDNRFILEDIAAENFGRDPFIIPSSIFAGSAGTFAETNGKMQRSVKSLGGLAFVYRYHWSIANIVPIESLAMYQSVFTLLLQLRRAISVLSKIKLVGSKTSSRQDQPKAVVEEQRLCLHIRHRLLNALTSLQDYFSHLAVAAPATTLQQQLNSAQSVDDLIAAHAAFVASVERKALLTKDTATAKTSAVSLFDLAVVFTDRWQDVQSTNKTLKLTQIRKQMDSLLDLIVGDLTSAARKASKDESWEVLAERLSWGSKTAALNF